MRGLASWLAVAELLLSGVVLGDTAPKTGQCVWKAGRSCDLTKSNKRLSKRGGNLPREECEAACLDIGQSGCCWWAHGSRVGEGCRFGSYVQDHDTSTWEGIDSAICTAGQGESVNVGGGRKLVLPAGRLGARARKLATSDALSLNGGGRGCSIDGVCVQSSNYGVDNYGVSETCSVNVPAGQAISVEAFETETGYDLLTINGNDYSGPARTGGECRPGRFNRCGMDPTLVTDGTPIEWNSDHDIAKRGWKICFCQLTALLNGDPHAVGAHGDKFSLRGEGGKTYSLLSAPNVSLNARFEDEAFVSPYSHVNVDGSFVRRAYWTLRTPATGRLVHIEFRARSPHIANINIAESGKVGDGTGESLAGKSLNISDDVAISGSEFTLEGLKVTLQKKTLTVSTPRWRMSAVGTIGYPHWSVARLGMRVTSLYRTCSEPVVPHGILGQTFDCDGVAVDGRKDSYDTLDDGTTTRSRSRGGSVTTKAQAEGAIEGRVADYEVGAPHETSFAFSRFDANASTPGVGPRNVMLSGTKRWSRRVLAAAAGSSVCV